MDYKKNAQHIIDLKNADLNLREELVKRGKLYDGYNEEMKALHNANADKLNKIIDLIGYPTAEKVGEEASEAAWLIIQHAIAKPLFMKRCLDLLNNAVDEEKANPINLAYLYDRIAVFEDKPQLYGTQFDWDENGQLSPNTFDDLDKVNKRRKEIGLNTLEEQIEIIRKRAKQENQLPPSNFQQRKQEIYEWKKSLGWIK